MMKLKKLIVYVCCVVMGMALFLLGRSSTLNAQEVSYPFRQSNLENIANTKVAQSAPLSNRLNQPTLVAATVDLPEVIKFACDPRQVEVHQYSGGVISYCKKKSFTIAETDSARVDIKPGAARAPHWHNTWEQQILLSGKAKTFVIDNKGLVHEEVLEPGMISFLPEGLTHWSEALGNEGASFLFIFPAGFKTFELGDSVANLNPNVMALIVGAKLSNVARNKDALVMLAK